MDWKWILDYIIRILGATAASLVITFASILFAKLKGKIKDARLKSYIEQAVKAAEQLYPNKGVKTGAEKYKYVKQIVCSHFPKIKDDAYLQSLIEGAVYSFTHNSKKLYKNIEKNIKKEENNKKDTNNDIISSS